jgi:hypothetical protein
VADAVATVWTTQEDDPRLVGYLVPGAGHEVQVSELRDHLRRTLPAYMVPQQLVVLDALPLTPNGKIDRAALPTPDHVHSAPDDHVPPTTPTERALAAFWCEALGVPEVSTLDNFFDLGGHSLLAMNVIGRAAKELGHRFTLLDFARQTLGQLAAERDRAANETGLTVGDTLLRRAVRALKSSVLRE